MILLIDNYDSFVHNLARYFERLGQKTHVVRNDALDADFARRLRPAAIVLSPGPCTPNEAGASLEIIAELEPTVRGAYCGSLGYIGLDGRMDTNILIRTVTASRGWWQLPVGGGIVAQSNPQEEYEETWHKAAGLLRALRP